MQLREEATADLSREAVGIARRDALKAVAALAASPLLGQQVPVAGQTPASRNGAGIGNKRNQLFDDGWRFFRGDAPGAERPDFNDNAWRTLDLPHDWSIENLPKPPGEENGSGTI